MGILPKELVGASMLFFLRWDWGFQIHICVYDGPKSNFPLGVCSGRPGLLPETQFTPRETPADHPQSLHSSTTRPPEIRRHLASIRHARHLVAHDEIRRQQSLAIPENRICFVRQQQPARRRAMKPKALKNEPMSPPFP